MECTEFGENTRSYITDYIKFGDAKAGASIGLIGAIDGAIILMAPEALACVSSAPSWLFVAAGALILGVAAASVMAVYHAVAALSPNTQPATSSLASFPDIAELDDEEYAKRVVSLDASEMAIQYALSVSALAKVASTKFKSISASMWWLRILLFASYGLALAYIVSLPCKLETLR